MLEEMRRNSVILEEMRGNFVVLEEMRGNFNVVIEMVRDCATRREVAELRENLSARMDLFTDALRVTRDEVKQNTTRLDGVDGRLDSVDRRLDGIDKHLDEVRLEIRGVRHDVAQHVERAEMRALEQRMTVVERHLGL
jgi:chromosome segregation ATPase